MPHVVTLKATRKGTIVATLEIAPDKRIDANGRAHRVPINASHIEAGLRALGIQLRRETYVLMRGSQIDPDAIGETGP